MNFFSCLYRLVCVGAFVTLLAQGGATARPVDALLAALPPDGVAGYSIDFKGLRASPHFGRAVEFFRRLGESGPVHPDKDSGLHPGMHIDAVAAALLPNGRALYAVEGAALDPGVIRAYFAKDSRGEGRGGDGERLLAPSSTIASTIAVHDGNVMAFLEPSLALIGRPADVQSALDSGQSDADRQQRLAMWHKRLAGLTRSAPFWFVADRPESDSLWSLPAELDGARAVQGYGELDSNAALDVHVRCATSDECSRVGDKLRQRVDGLRRRLAVRLSGVGAALDRIRVEPHGASVHVKAALKSIELRAVLGLGPKVVKLVR